MWDKLHLFATLRIADEVQGLPINLQFINDRIINQVPKQVSLYQQKVWSEDVFSHPHTRLGQVQKNAPSPRCSIKNIAGLDLQTPHCIRKE